VGENQKAPISWGNLTVFGAGDRVVITADEVQSSKDKNLEIFLLGGKPIRQPVVAYGPFVMNTKEQIIQAMEDYNYGRFGQIPDDALMPFHHRHGR
jgi:redox-sensitive bicupin YhaK (pirin superfamily)